MIRSDFIRRKRIQRGFSPMRLAVTVGVSLDAVRSWERGDREPGATNLVKLAWALKVKVEELVVVEPK